MPAMSSLFWGQGKQSREKTQPFHIYFFYFLFNYHSNIDLSSFVVYKIKTEIYLKLQQLLTGRFKTQMCLSLKSLTAICCLQGDD